MTEQIYDYDPAQALDSPEAMALFIADALDTGDTAYIAKAMGVVARAKDDGVGQGNGFGQGAALQIV